VKSRSCSTTTSSSERGMMQMSTDSHHSRAPTGRTTRSGMIRCGGEGGGGESGDDALGDGM
jgi:hypothetical protein